MLHDIYLENKLTGELVPYTQVSREFYKTHGAFDSIFDEWTETKLEVEDEYLTPPDFRHVFNW